jgi:signal transduction histidine kinase
LPEPVEAAVYFVAAEALTNVAKYAAASRVELRVERGPQAVVVEVADDGVGGADAAVGSGLVGLADRVGTLGGTLSMTSPLAGGTSVRAEIPLP